MRRANAFEYWHDLEDMDRENCDVSKQRTPDNKMQSTRREPDWKQIAEEMSKAQSSSN